MSSRTLNSLEQKIHQAVLSAPEKCLSQAADIDKLASDAPARTTALNFLLGTGLLNAMKNGKGRPGPVYRAVTKNEMDVTKNLSVEEAVVYNCIRAADNQGIWTKHIKTKTGLHQTVVDRCLKTLVQKQLVKTTKSMQHPTRKIYMLFYLEPPIELTGGPWYTDFELDTEFVRLLCSACLQFIKDRSFPKQQRVGQHRHSQSLYPISSAPRYPSAAQVSAFLEKSQITETDLTAEHVETLLNVLVLDGEIERLPAFGAAFWDSSFDSAEEHESNEEYAATKNRKHTRRKDSGSDAASDSNYVAQGEKTKIKSQKRKRTETSDSEPKIDRQKKGRVESSEDDSSKQEEKIRKKQKGKEKTKTTRKYASSDSDVSDYSTNSSRDSRPCKHAKTTSRKHLDTPELKLARPSGPGGTTDVEFAETRTCTAPLDKKEFRWGYLRRYAQRVRLLISVRMEDRLGRENAVYYGKWLDNAAVAVG